MKSFTELLRDARRLHQSHHLDEAARLYRELLRIRPTDFDAIMSLGRIRFDQGRVEEAAVQFAKAAGINPRDANAHYFLGLAHTNKKQFFDAARAFRAAYETGHDSPFALGEWAFASLKIADWSCFAQQERELIAAVRAGALSIDPVTFLRFSDNPADLLKCAQAYLAGQTAGSRPVVQRSFDPHRRRGEKIRVGYVSADFRVHPTTSLLTGLIETHDRGRFEIVGVSIGEDDGSAERRRIVAAFDRFVDAADWQVAEIGENLHALNIDILVDLMGYTSLNQAAALATRPAPIQVNYLGYPGTLGAPFIDYILADSITIPAELAPYFSEKFVHLPDCYQPNDRNRPRPQPRLPRADCGLPDGSFVFCCLSDTLKLTPYMFDVWMRLLQAAPNSVLWLLGPDDTVATNLRREAAARSVEPTRLVFAPHVSVSEHLARYPLADLFLDTLPYNAHTTASEALWMGVPVVTCMGRSFAARVCASILHAAGLPELVTHSLEEYEALALALARDPERLRGLRARIEANRTSAPLFDTPRYCAHIEAAYVTMMEIWQRNEPPRSFAVPPIGPS